MRGGPPPKNRIQLIWGLALVIAGLAVLIKIWFVMPQLNQLQQSSSLLGIMRIIGICIIGVILIGGGLRKIWAYFQESQER